VEHNVAENHRRGYHRPSPTPAADLIDAGNGSVSTLVELPF
jgi:hypothetical protein